MRQEARGGIVGTHKAFRLEASHTSSHKYSSVSSVGLGPRTGMEASDWRWAPNTQPPQLAANLITDLAAPVRPGL